jgi:Sulfotransferase family
MNFPPFIIGAPRSGTTLLRFMLDAHPMLAIPAETGFIPLSIPTWLGSHFQKKWFYFYLTRPRSAWDDFGLARDVFWNELQLLKPFTISEGLRAFYRLYAAKFDKPLWGDKTPRYTLQLNEIRVLLPEVKFIHLIRDGRDAMISLRHQWFSPGQSVSTQAQFWLHQVQTARTHGLGHDDYLEVHYKKLILEPRAQLLRICQFLGLEYSDTMLEYAQHAKLRLSEHRGRKNIFGQEWLSSEARVQQQHRTTQPLDKTLIEQWRTILTQAEQDEYWQIAGDILTDLGYQN